MKYLCVILTMMLAFSIVSAEASGINPIEDAYQTIEHDGLERQYKVVLPSRYDADKTYPLVFAFHGGGGSIESFAKRSGFSELAERKHFILVYPQGTPTGRNGFKWNPDSEVFRKLGYEDIDDLGFIRKLHMQLTAEYKIDPKRVFASGMSMGGMMSYHVACHMSDVFAAIGVVGTTMTTQNCAPDNPVSILHIHGKKDTIVQFKGGTGTKFSANYDWPPVLRGIKVWHNTNACNIKAARTEQLARDTQCKVYDCNAETEVSLCMVEDMGHNWPGLSQEPWQRLAQQQATKTFHAADVVWEFFQKHPKN